MAIQVLDTFRAHDARHDLESAVWLLLCTVLRHTLQVTEDQDGTEDEDSGTEDEDGTEDEGGEPEEYERYELYRRYFDTTTETASVDKKNWFVTNPMKWAVKGNQPLTTLIRELRKLVFKQNRDPEWGPPVSMTYKSVLTQFNRALTSSGWPENDAALPFTLTHDNNSSESRGQKRVRDDAELDTPDEGGDGVDAMDNSLLQRAAKRPQVGPSPLRNEIEANPFEDDDEELH